MQIGQTQNVSMCLASNYDRSLYFLVLAIGEGQTPTVLVVHPDTFQVTAIGPGSAVVYADSDSYKYGSNLLTIRVV